MVVIDLFGFSVSLTSWCETAWCETAWLQASTPLRSALSAVDAKRRYVIDRFVR